MKFPLLPKWQERIASAPRRCREPKLRVPLSAEKLSSTVQLVQTKTDAEQMVQFVYESPVSCVGVDTEFRFDSPPVSLRGQKQWRDIRSIQPFCIAFAIVTDESIVKYALDLRNVDLLEFAQCVLDLPVPFVCHYAPAELFVIWQLGLREPRTLWDTLLGEKALQLGLGRSGCSRTGKADPSAIAEQRKSEELNRRSLNLDAVAVRYHVALHRSASKQRLQTSFLDKPSHEAMTVDELTYCADDAEAAARIREPQRMACDQNGIIEVLDSVVMPWNVTSAEIQWVGVKFNRDRCRRFCQASRDVQTRITEELSQFGITKPGSAKELSGVMDRLGLGRYFPRTDSGQIGTADKLLKSREHLHPIIPLVRRYRKIRTLSNDPAVTGVIEGVDNRVHAQFMVLGADSGRTQSKTPNLMGIGRVFRPFICASDGCGIGDVDLSQIEIGIAAAVFHDEQMIKDFNTGDVYVAQAKRILHDEISAEDFGLPDAEFKHRYKNLRDRCKPLALGIIYGKTPYGIAADLGISIRAAKQLWDTFSGHYEKLCTGMEQAREQSVRRGYAYITGLRRFHGKKGKANNHEKRGLGNSYVQGTAGIVFFDAGNRLRRLYRPFGAKLIIPVHDAFVFEAPLDRIHEVAELTRRVMVETVQHWFPELLPRADVNVIHPECWNYEGHADSVEQFITDPMLQL